MNKSPALMWTNPPAGTMSFVVTLLDKTNTNIHWAACNIPATRDGACRPHIAAANLPMGAQQTGTWYGPGAGDVHQYEYKVWALKTPTLEGGCNMGAQGYKNTLYRTLLPALNARDRQPCLERLGQQRQRLPVAKKPHPLEKGRAHACARPFSFRAGSRGPNRRSHA